METEQDLDFKSTYDWCVRAFSLVKDRLGVKIRLNDDQGCFPHGDIYLFNHFARFETIIPQYLIYQATGGYCRCVAAGELFRINESFTRFLYGVGAVPHDHPHLLPFLAAEILRGHKVIIFPEGGMIKDRQVLDPTGGYSIFSPTAKIRRKHHSGAAVLGLTVEIFKQRMRMVDKRGEHDRLARWAKALDLEDIDVLMAAANKPTNIIPSNITFYPLRASDNILSRGAEFLSQGSNARMVEELLIEGNILLKDSDMDIRVGQPLEVHKVWRWWERWLLSRMFEKIHSLEDLFSLSSESERFDERLFAMAVTRGSGRLRDQYMEAIYLGVTVNLSHLAALLVRYLAERGEKEVPFDRFQRALYLAVKACQKIPEVHLHRSLTLPERYWGLGEGESCPDLDRFFANEGCREHIAVEGDLCRFDDSVLEEQDFNRVRLENLITVYANEVAPIKSAVAAVEKSWEKAALSTPRDLSGLLFDDELLSLHCDRDRFDKEEHREINQQQGVTTDPAPFLLLPKKAKPLGVLLVHGLLASPAEMRSFGEQLSALGYPVMGVRLKGHGTSPWDLREREWEEWLESLRRGKRVLSAYAERVVVVGFATGGALALLLAEREKELAGVIALSVPWEFRVSSLLLASLARGLGRLTGWVPSLESRTVFRDHEPEHPEISYRHVPVRTVYEHYQLRQILKRILPQLRCPVLYIQGEDDPVVTASGAEELFELIGSEEKSLRMVPADRHSILLEDLGGCRDQVIAFLGSLPLAGPALEAGAISGVTTSHGPKEVMP